MQFQDTVSTARIAQFSVTCTFVWQHMRLLGVIQPLWGGGGGSGLFTPGKKHLVFGRNKSESLVTAMLAEKWSFQSLPCESELFIDHQAHMICVSFIY